MNNDAISAAITTIRNANMKKKTIIRIPATLITKRIVQILLREGFLRDVAEHEENKKEVLDISLKHFGKKKKPYITAIKRISKPGLRIYLDHREITKVLSGMGIAILPTSHGLITDREARQKRVGGEVICHVW